VERGWHHWVHLDQLDGEAVSRELHALVTADEDHPLRLAHAQRRIARLDAERLKLVQMAYADAIPLDLLKSEQQRIAVELDQAKQEAERAQDSGRDVMAVYEQARALMQRGAAAYKIAGPDARRTLTRAFLARIEVDTDHERATLASPWIEIQRAAEYVRPISPVRPSRPSGQHGGRGNRQNGRPTTTNPGLLSQGRGSIMNPLVES
jgi:hypothetical protein